jgi:uncharacterized protein involved in exopolysaccharide biosynthesis
MTGRAEQSFEVRAILAAVARRSGLLLLIGLVTAGVTALVLALTPRKYEGTMVLVPVQGARANAALAGAASFLGGSLDLGTSGFDATRDVVAYLLRARTVLLAVADQPYQGRPVAVAIVKRAPKVGDEELLLRDLRHALRVTTSKETGFVTMSVQAVDSGAVRAFLGAVTDQTQRLFAEVARSQARQLLRAQERRLDSASAELKRSEDRLLRFDEGNRLLTPRSRLSLERARLDREVLDATRVYEQVVTDRQSAIARELEEAPAIAVVEHLPVVMPPKPRRLLFRSILLGVAVAVVGLLVVVTGELARSSAALEGRGV